MSQLELSKTTSQTPLMRQYWGLKEKCPHAILFFRLGDFYEMFGEDAQTAAPILDIALTSRDKKSKQPLPMCGVPYHSAKNYITKLLDAGFHVAICEQTEEATKGKKLVQRDIVRMITPGTRSDEEGLAPGDIPFIACVAGQEDTWTLSWIEVSTGQLEYASALTQRDCLDLLMRLKPTELVTYGKLDWLYPALGSLQEVQSFSAAHMEEMLLSRYGVSHPSVLGIQPGSLDLKALFGLLYYIETLNMASIPNLQMPVQFDRGAYLHMDPQSLSNLDVFAKDKPSLFSLLNQTKTSAGARELKKWLMRPLFDRSEIERRLDHVQALSEDSSRLQAIRKILQEVRDVERVAARIQTSRALVRDLEVIRKTLGVLPELCEVLRQSESKIIKEMATPFDMCETLRDQLERGLADQPNAFIHDGGVIRDGYSAELDELKSVSKDNKSWIAALQEQERKQTGIPSLKVGYNKVFGYYLEVTKVHLEKVPAHYIRKQTLVQAERFITEDLKNKEEEILSAKSRMLDMERSLFEALVRTCDKHMKALLHNADLLSTLDVLCALAHVSNQYGWTRPTFVEDQKLDIKQGRHPVVEATMRRDAFVPNDVYLDQDTQNFILLTGPNMAGKSTVMRQVALIVIMAQMGSNVPAKQVTMGLVDQIFTRIGAQDDLSQGRSTFMVEMNETAHLLHHATDKSLVLLDEIGRGTSTFDGVSIAWAVSAHLHDRIGAKTIFATHYHELTEMLANHPKMKCFQMKVTLHEGEIIFLRNLMPGQITRSYGIEVAKLAGLPQSVVDHAKEVLQGLETHVPSEPVAQPTQNHQDSWLEKDLKALNPDEITPKHAFDLIYDWNKRLRSS